MQLKKLQSKKAWIKNVNIAGNFFLSFLAYHVERLIQQSSTGITSIQKKSFST